MQHNPIYSYNNSPKQLKKLETQCKKNLLAEQANTQHFNV